MTDEILPFPEETPAPTKEAPRTKRISNPRPKKTAKESPVEAPAMLAETPTNPQPAEIAEAPASPQPAEIAEAPTSPQPAEIAEAPTNPQPAEIAEAPTNPQPAEIAEAPTSSQPPNDWPEPEPASTGSAPNAEHPKRKRRRKKGKGGSSQNQAPQNESEPQISTVISEPFDSSNAPQVSHTAPQAPRPHPQPRMKFDTEVIAKLAWKIYLSEVSEEGVALIGDGDAKELSRRCFRLAEIFMEEQFRRN